MINEFRYVGKTASSERFQCLMCYEYFPGQASFLYCPRCGTKWDSFQGIPPKYSKRRLRINRYLHLLDRNSPRKRWVINTVHGSYYKHVETINFFTTSALTIKKKLDKFRSDDRVLLGRTGLKYEPLQYKVFVI